MSTETRDRILDAAEELFAEKGIAASSLRRLTGAAGVNLAAVHYHFGSKDGLVDAVLERRAADANRERLAELARIEGCAAPEPADVEEILTAFIAPQLRSLAAFSDRRALLGRLKARIEAEPPEIVEALFRRHFGFVCARFTEALQRALPDLTKEEVAARFRFALGTISFAFSDSFDLDTIPGHPPSKARPEVKLERLIAFLVPAMGASIRAPRRTP